MGTKPIRAVVFDLGGTLEDIYYDDASRMAATRGLDELLASHGLDLGLSIADLNHIVLSGMREYQKWRESTEIELPPERVWTEYIFPNHRLPLDRLKEAAEDLTLFWENNFYTRTLRPEVPGILAALHERGFRLAVISNVISRRQVQHNLAAYGLDHNFDPIMTSSGLGIRKPNPRIFLETAQRMNLPPAECAYVGDTISRDVVGARHAGYGLAIQIKSFVTSHSDRETYSESPDAVIENLSEILPLLMRKE